MHFLHVDNDDSDQTVLMRRLTCLRLAVCFFYVLAHIQSNLDVSNTDGSFTMANSYSFLSPYEILPTAQENKYLRKFSYFIVKLYFVCIH